MKKAMSVVWKEVDKVAGPDGKPKYRERLVQYLKLMHDGRDAQAAFAENYVGLPL